MNLREKKGSIAIFVLVALLFMASFLIIMFSGNINKSKIVKEQTDIIRQIYGKSVKRLEEIEDILSAIPEIKFEISEITGGVKNIKITTNGITEAPYSEKYKIDNEIKTSKEEFYEYVNAYVEDGVEKEVTVTITNDLRNTATITQKVKFIRPTIKALPKIINVENIENEETYVEYDEMEGTTEYIAFDQTFTSFEKLINHVKDNNKYEKVDLIVNAKGNNYLNSTATYSVTFLTNDKPEIKNLPNPIYINYTEVEESYVEKNGVEIVEEQYIIVYFNEPHDTMTELIKQAEDYMLKNNIEEMNADIKIIAKGKNNTSVESIQNVKFLLPRPKIKNLPSEICINYTEVAESYVEKNGVEIVEEQYIIVDLNDETYSTMTEVVNRVNEWIVENGANEVEGVTIKVIAKGANNTNAEKTQKVTFKLPATPVIGKIPTSIITNVTQVNKSYVTYDNLEKKEEIYTIVEVPELTFDTMIDVVNFANTWLIENKQYEVDVNIKIMAKGDNDIPVESTQPVKFIRGTKVASETDLINALYSTTPSYIKVETTNDNNEIICNSPITLNGVSHKLDLNGNTISYTVNSASEGSTLKFLTVGADSSLTVIDSSEEGKGGIVFNVLEEVTADGDDRKTKAITVDNQGVVNVESGIIEVNISRKMGNDKRKDGNVHDTGVAIENSGTVNLNGGTILTNVVTQSCSYLTIQISEAVAKGIVNNGTINVTSGTINTNAEAYAVRASGAVWKGETEAYAYGIENNGTINNSENITFSTTATAHEENSRDQTSEALDIK